MPIQMQLSGAVYPENSIENCEETASCNLSFNRSFNLSFNQTLSLLKFLVSDRLFSAELPKLPQTKG